MSRVERELLMLGGAIALYLVWKDYQGAETIVTKHANPAHQDNLVNRGVSAVTGQKGWFVGGFIYDSVDSVQDVLPFVDSDREKQEKLEEQYRKQHANTWYTHSYNNLPEIF